MMTLNPFTIKRKAGPFMAPLAHSAMALVLLNGFPCRALAQDSHSHARSRNAKRQRKRKARPALFLKLCANQRNDSRM